MWRWDAHTGEHIASSKAKYWDGSIWRSAAPARMMSLDMGLTGLLLLADANTCNVCVGWGENSSAPLTHSAGIMSGTYSKLYNPVGMVHTLFTVTFATLSDVVVIFPSYGTWPR